jgi:hypothetical protein
VIAMAKNKNKKIERLKTSAAKERDRLYMEGHQRRPEDLDWAENSAKLLSKRLPKEKW